MIRVVADRRVLVVSGRASEFAEAGQEVVVQGGRVVVEEACQHPAAALADPRPAATSAGPERAVVVTCRQCHADVVLSPDGGARLLGRGSMATTVRG